MEGYLKQEKLKAKVEKALNAKAKAEEYLAKKEAEEAAGVDGLPPPPWEAPPPPMGVQAMAEAKIAAALNDGLLDDLQGKGRPLPRDPSSETPWNVDAGQAALNRMLKSAGFKPTSVEAREAVGKARRGLENALALAVARGADTLSALTHTPKGAGARAAHRELETAVKAYNMAIVCDRESFGAAWPLQNAKAGDFEEHATRALRRDGEGGGGDTGGGGDAGGGGDTS